MNAITELEKLPRETLIEIIEMLGRNWLTVDGLWFQNIENEFGLETAVRFDEKIWERQSLIEAGRIKRVFEITEKGLLAVVKANIFLAAYFNPAFDFELQEISPNEVIQTCIHCPNQEVRIKQGQEIFPCKKVGLMERTNFAKVIDPEVKVECLVCPPDPRPPNVWCQWKLTK